MAKRMDGKQASGVLTRLLKDQSGNVAAMFALSIVPIMGFAGGGLDISRIYLTRTSLQSACDAGSLTGRKVMGTGTWASNNFAANVEAQKMFRLNFVSGAYGTENGQVTYTEAGSAVTGVATAEVPMTLTALFGQDTRTVQVSCRSELRIPNTDVMFVLDVTGSMTKAADGTVATATNPARIDGLRTATKCFYEALAKENIDDVTPEQCSETTDPVNVNAPGVQLRFGFVPYAVNVNVGKLLPQDYLADNWTYQSRVAHIEPAPNNQPDYGPESAQIPGSITTVNNTTWSQVASDVVVGGITYSTQFNAPNSSICATTAKPATVVGTGTWSTPTFNSSTTQPVYPDTTPRINTYISQKLNGNTEYRYVFIGSQCRLQSRTTANQTQTRPWTTTQSVTWVLTNKFTRYVYRPVTFNVSGLKGNNAWNNSIELPVGDQGANRTVTWDGCIEERKTRRLSDNNPFDEWDPIPIEEAIDMDIDRAPETGNTDTQWGPMLSGVLYRRTSLNFVSNGQAWIGNQTRSNVTVTAANIANAYPGYEGLPMIQPTVRCPSESRLNQEWSPDAYKSYVNSLTTGGNTYHDIGLLWGARLMSPTGIFSALNATPNRQIQRHMIFMTDGGTMADPYDYSAYGLHWYDRRQTILSSAPTNIVLQDNIDARTAALCNAIKNQNITLWVVSFGSDVGSATNARLASCATPGRFFQAANIPALVQNFKGIAADISALRLTE